MRKSNKIIYFLIVFVAGILIRSLYPVVLLSPLIIALTGLVVAVAFYQADHKFKQRISILLLGSVFLFLGILRVELFLPDVTESHILNFNGQVAQFTGRVVVEPDEREKNIQYHVDVNDVVGDVLVFGPKFSVYEFGDVLAIQCRLEQPKRIENFNYPGFLAKEGVYSVCFKPQSVDKINCHAEPVEACLTPSSPFDRLRVTAQGWLIVQKQSFKSIIDSSVNFPASTFFKFNFIRFAARSTG